VLRGRRGGRREREVAVAKGVNGSQSRGSLVKEVTVKKVTAKRVTVRVKKGRVSVVLCGWA
jgi:hypothetical protein